MQPSGSGSRRSARRDAEGVRRRHHRRRPPRVRRHWAQGQQAGALRVWGRVVLAGRVQLRRWHWCWAVQAARERLRSSRRPQAALGEKALLWQWRRPQAVLGEKALVWQWRGRWGGQGETALPWQRQVRWGGREGRRLRLLASEQPAAPWRLWAWTCWVRMSWLRVEQRRLPSAWNAQGGLSGRLQGVKAGLAWCCWLAPPAWVPPAWVRTQRRGVQEGLRHAGHAAAAQACRVVQPRPRAAEAPVLRWGTVSHAVGAWQSARERIDVAQPGLVQHAHTPMLCIHHRPCDDSMLSRVLGEPWVARPKILSGRCRRGARSDPGPSAHYPMGSYVCEWRA